MSRLDAAAEMLEARKAAAFGVTDLDDLPPRTLGGNETIARIIASEGVTAEQLEDYAGQCVRTFRAMFGALSFATEAQLGGIMEAFWTEGVMLGMMLGKVSDE